MARIKGPDFREAGMILKATTSKSGMMEAVQTLTEKEGSPPDGVYFYTVANTTTDPECWLYGVCWDRNAIDKAGVHEYLTRIEKATSKTLSRSLRY